MNQPPSKVLLRLLFFWIWIAKVSAMQGTLQTLSPCPSQVLIMERIVGGPPGQANHWDGVVLLRNWPNTPTVHLTLTFDSEAKVKVDHNDGHVSVYGNQYQISYFNAPPLIDRVSFNVQGQRGGFPNPTSLLLNGQDICHQTVAAPGQARATRRPATRNPGQGGKKPPPAGPTKRPGPGTRPAPRPAPKPPTAAPFKPATPPRVNVAERFQPDTCGKRLVHHQGLVTSGYPSQEGDWPWHTGIYHRKNVYDYGYKCGGSLVSPKFVLTAGHCVIEGGGVILEERILVKLGQYSRSTATPNTREYNVYQVIPHSEFGFSDLKNDIALLKLTTQVSFSNYIQPVCLWPKSKAPLENVINKNGLVVGWGLNEKDELTDVLTQGNMPIVSALSCLESNRDFFGSFLSDYNYCAGFRNGTSVCNGDSGGGMVFEIDKHYYIRGLVSLSVSRGDKNICNPKQFVIFTDVAKYLSWIEQHMK